MIKASIPKDALLLLRITGAASRINKAHPHKLKKMSTFFSIGEPETFPLSNDTKNQNLLRIIERVEFLLYLTKTFIIHVHIIITTYPQTALLK